MITRTFGDPTVIENIQYPVGSSYDNTYSATPPSVIENTQCAQYMVGSCILTYRGPDWRVAGGVKWKASFSFEHCCGAVFVSEGVGVSQRRAR